MKKYDLFGLSAPQIGLPLRLFIVAFPRPEDDFSQDEITRLEMKAFPHNYGKYKNVSSYCSVVQYSHYNKREEGKNN